jgi:predicted flap endonuclease-1-like 5' DNA nuclease
VKYRNKNSPPDILKKLDGIGPVIIKKYGILVE